MDGTLGFILSFLLGYGLGRVCHYYGGRLKNGSRWIPHHYIPALVIICAPVVLFRIPLVRRHASEVVGFGVGLFASDALDFWWGKTFQTEENDLHPKSLLGID